MDEENIHSLVTRYEKSALLRALVQLLPLSIGGAFDAYVLTRYNNLKADRTRTFFDQLHSGQIDLHTELLENNEFIHCFMATYAAAMRAHQNEKIVSLANLLVGAVNKGEISSIDEYEEMLSILDDMSLREFIILDILYRHESSHPQATLENISDRANLVWNSFLEEVHRKYGISGDYLSGVLTRLTRTGCFEIITSPHVGYISGRGYTTSLYKKIRSFVITNSD